jgi:citrate lyase subunit beta/citryl-CoA lyase
VSARQPGRSLLSAPASDERKIERALTSPADAVILDLEDAVTAAKKSDGLRSLVSRSWLVGGVAVPLVVRVNQVRSPWCHQELIALCDPALPFSALMLPKVESAGDLAFVDRLLDGAEAAYGRPTPISIYALVETAASIQNLREIASASPRLGALVLGYADLGASLGRSPSRPDHWLGIQDILLTAARAAGIAAIDGPHLGIADDDPFRASVSHAAEFGFDGKWVIHPQQLATVNREFLPTPEQIQAAEGILAALAEGQSIGHGAVAVNGQMVDEALAVGARAVLARAAAAT